MKVAVILVAHGEAETAGFIENYSMIRHTLAQASEVMVLSRSLQLMVSVVGALKNSLSFRFSGYRSPQNEITRRQASLLQLCLTASSDEEKIDYTVFPAFHATPPFVSDLLDATQGHDFQVLVSMSPVDSRMTSGSLQLLASRGCRDADKPDPLVVDRFWQDDTLRSLYCDHIFRHGRNERGTVLLLAFHGTLVKDVRGMEPDFHAGRTEIEHMGRSLCDAILGDSRNLYDRVEVTHLNHTMGGTWTEPSLPCSLGELHFLDVNQTDVFCCGYFSDGTETLLYARKDAENCPVDVLFLPASTTTGPSQSFLRAG